MKLDELVTYLDTYLNIPAIKDYGPQGLQIEGKEEVNRIVGTVDAQSPSVEAAIAKQADLLLVHHGIFWGGAKPLRGGYGRLVHAYMAAELNLYAAHLALDAHREVGNNAELARRLGLEIIDWWGNANGVQLAVLAVNDHGVKLDYLIDRFEHNVGPVKLVQAHGPRIIHKVGILSGFGAREIEEAASLGCDLYLTGETSHAQYYDAQVAGINVIYGGHYTTETVGVQALGKHLQEQFALEFTFIDLPTGL
ncbi:MAG TPA: Nif3-like dinuclear metal center hexameric protein [Caldilineaceae bacterium]|nr:Nif3-like dinuclear metal center hexameric protein [Caldilineaceae bacterium]